MFSGRETRRPALPSWCHRGLVKNPKRNASPPFLGFVSPSRGSGELPRCDVPSAWPSGLAPHAGLSTGPACPDGEGARPACAPGCHCLEALSGDGAEQFLSSCDSISHPRSKCNAGSSCSVLLKNTTTSNPSLNLQCTHSFTTMTLRSSEFWNRQLEKGQRLPPTHRAKVKVPL